MRGCYNAIYRLDGNLIMDNIVVYNDGELELKVSVEEETVWLTQKQIAEVFDVNVPAISKHIKNIYKDNELEQFSTVSILEIVEKQAIKILDGFTQLGLYFRSLHVKLV